MPLTARLSGYRDPLDASQDDLGAGLSWDVVRGGDPRPDLRCPVCQGGMHARQSRRGTRFFAHNPYAAAERCPHRSGETEEHLTLKREIARAVRGAGWHATVEHAETDWRADVLAENPQRSWRIAWEAQLSRAVFEDLSDRTARYASDGVRVCWVTTDARTPWLGRLPSLLLEEHTSKKGNQVWMVNRGHATLADKPLAGLHAVDHKNLSRRMSDLVGEHTLAWDRRHRSEGTGPAAPWKTLLPEQISWADATPVAASAFRARVGWFGQRLPLYKFVDDLQHGRLVPVELAPPHQLIYGSKPMNGSHIIWIPVSRIARAHQLAGFSYGWDALDCTAPRSCCADTIPDGSEDAVHCIRLVNPAGAGDTHLCWHCDPLADLAVDLANFEDDTSSDLPTRVGFRRRPALVYDAPLPSSDEDD